MSKEFTVDAQHRTHFLSHDSRRGAVSIVNGNKVYDNVVNPIAYAKRIFANEGQDANVFVRFGSEDHQYRIDPTTHKIEFPWK
jgi:hypothetical protein